MEMLIDNSEGGVERVGGVGVESRCISIQALNGMPFSEVNVENRRRSGPKNQPVHVYMC